MQVTNRTRKTILAKQLIIPNSFLDQALGLLRHKNPIAMLFHTRYGLHTFGMQYPIDIIVLGKANTVVSLKENFLPNHLFIWHPRHNKVLELPAGTIKKTETKNGDEIAIK